MEVILIKRIKRTYLGETKIYEKGTVAYVDDDSDNDAWLLDFYDGYVWKVKRNNFICL